MKTIIYSLVYILLVAVIWYVNPLLGLGWAIGSIAAHKYL